MNERVDWDKLVEKVKKMIEESKYICARGGYCSMGDVEVKPDDFRPMPYCIVPE